ncbi:conserved hypothetical protein [Desulfamplus magnetovallimortis]|uniref:Putative restriction endonuclease domain-containing protein n=1 Tax=Desulfamplus magnetovallimortis TaxID=1246637 RepID=A0A1W1H815_9BACT|nr:Uma2 family endonuclease [Desulfamplus magnetovallimortis]SLM28593.1 conserved hypothetical protein [Desulfamplus magnetovallimortis]
MNAQPQENIPMMPEEYLEFDKNSEIRHEYFDGEIFAMTGASLDHNQLNHNINRILGNQLLDGNCRVFASDMRVKVEKIDKYTYPDISVVCGAIELEMVKGVETILNPVVIIEILSDSTEAYDRGQKFTHYRLMPSLKEYLLVSQSNCQVEKFLRKKDGSWNMTSYDDLKQSIKIESIGCELLLSDIYRWVSFKK